MPGASRRGSIASYSFSPIAQMASSPSACDVDREAFGLEPALDGQGESLVVVDDEYSHSSTVSPIR